MCLLCGWVFVGVSFAADTVTVMLTRSILYIMPAKWDVLVSSQQPRLADPGDSDFYKPGMLPKDVLLKLRLVKMHSLRRTIGIQRHEMD